MVKTLAIHLNDDDFEELKELKTELRMTWEEFVIEAAQELERSERAD